MSLLLAARALEADAQALAVVRSAAAERLTQRFGRGHWSSPTLERQALRSIQKEHVLVARNGAGIVGSLSLVTKKPWAIDVSYFTPVRMPLYLLNMAVHPASQGKGVGRFLLEEADLVARAWPADAIRLDAYDAPAGAGGFYDKTGYREVGRAVYRGVPLIYYERVLT